MCLPLQGRRLGQSAAGSYGALLMRHVSNSLHATLSFSGCLRNNLPLITSSPRYFNSSSRRVATLGIKGTAPISATFEGAHGNTSGVLHVNLQKSTVLRDVSASNGVLHVLDFSEDYGGASGEGAGVVVPDVLELTYAYGFHTMYESIISADSDVTSGGDRHNTSDGPRVDEEASGGQPGGGSSVGGVSVAQALRGEAPHTLLAVRYSQAENAFLDVASSTGSWRLNGDGVSEGTLR